MKTQILEAENGDSEEFVADEAIDDAWNEDDFGEEAETSGDYHDVDYVDLVAEFEKEETGEDYACVAHGVDNADLDFGELQVVFEVVPVEVGEIWTGPNEK